MLLIIFPDLIIDAILLEYIIKMKCAYYLLSHSMEESKVGFRYYLLNQSILGNNLWNFLDVD
jgi:hypothetical protein